MAEMLFTFDKGNFRECQNLFRGGRDQEYYRGDFWIEDSSTIEVTSERKTVGPISIIRQRSATNLFFRRTRQHIREDATDLSILWFVKRGRLVLSNQCGNKVAQPGDFAITRSMSPFLHGVPDRRRRGARCAACDGADAYPAHSHLAGLQHRAVHADRPRGIRHCREHHDRRVRRRGRAWQRVGERARRHRADDHWQRVAPRRGDSAEPARHRRQAAGGGAALHSRPPLGPAVVDGDGRPGLRHLAALSLVPAAAEGNLLFRAGLGISGWKRRANGCQRPIRARSRSARSHMASASRVPAHFSRMFKRVFHVNPSACRGSAPRPAAVAVQKAVGPTNSPDKTSDERGAAPREPLRMLAPLH